MSLDYTFDFSPYTIFGARGYFGAYRSLAKGLFASSSNNWIELVHARQAAGAPAWRCGDLDSESGPLLEPCHICHLDSTA